MPAAGPSAAPDRRRAPINYVFAVGGNAVASTVFWRLVEFWGASSFADYAVLSGFLFAYSAAIYIPHPLFDGNDRPERWTVAAVHLGYDALRAVLTAVVFYSLAVGAPAAV